MNRHMCYERIASTSSRRRRIGVALSLLGAVALSASCPTLTLAAGFSGTTTLKTVDDESGSFLYVLGNARFSNPDNCGSNNGAVVLESNPDYKAMVAMILDAYTTGQQVQFFLNGCSGTAWGFTLPIIATVTMNPSAGEFGP